MEVFQTFEYNGRVLQLATYEPDSSARPAAKDPSIKAPGAGKFGIGAINLSTAKIIAGEELTLTAQVNGKNIAYIYSEVLFHDKSLNQFYGPVAREYIQADRSKESGGVSRPDWEDTINIAVRLSPGLRLLTDGVDSAFGFLLPAGYGNSEYRLDGLYTPADGAAQRRVRITFDSAGETTDVVAYKEQGGRATPHALRLKQGDQFTPFVQILTQPTNENPAWQVTKGLSTPLTFHGQPLRWAAEPLLPGDYLIGLLVQDLDGGLTRKYAPLTVTE
jgi:hypothetical protein